MFSVKSNERNEAERNKKMYLYVHRHNLWQLIYEAITLFSYALPFYKKDGVEQLLSASLPPFHEVFPVVLCEVLQRLAGHQGTSANTAT